MRPLSTCGASIIIHACWNVANYSIKTPFDILEHAHDIDIHDHNPLPKTLSFMNYGIYTLTRDPKSIQSPIAIL